MTKGPAFDFLGLYLNILRDVEGYLPNDRAEWCRDFKSLSALFQTRGIGLFTLDLPALDKSLLQGFQTGRLNVENLPLSRRRSSTDRVPRLFWGLWSRVFDRNGCLKADIDVNIIFFLRTLLCTGKTLEIDADPKYLYKATKELFDVDSSLPIPSGFWDFPTGDGIRVSSLSDSLHDYVISDRDLFSHESEPSRGVLDSIQQCADRTSGLLGLFDPDIVHFRHGPGAVSDLSSGSYKYDFRAWSDRLDSVFPWSEWGTTPLGFMDRLQSDGITMDSSEPIARLIAVPKTRKGPRLIASEPASNQWIQQGIRDFLYLRIGSGSIGRSIDFGRQDLSGADALESSIDGSRATIDLSSASDRISCWLVERMFRRNPGLLVGMAACRTRYLSNTLDRKLPSLLKLRKFSTMGNALTFPVQSLVFFNICCGVGKFLNPRRSWEDIGRQVRIYGDDLIVPVHWEPLIEVCLTHLYLKVNRSKTFTKGNFRESCGTDAFKGYDVTPARIGKSDQEPEATLMASRVACSNNFHMKGLWNAAAWLAQTAPYGRRSLIVNCKSGVFGLRTFSNGPSPPLRKIRWNSALQRREVHTVTPFAKQSVRRQESAACLLQYFTEEPESWFNYESGVAVAGRPAIRSTWVSLGLLCFTDVT